MIIGFLTDSYIFVINSLCQKRFCFVCVACAIVEKGFLVFSHMQLPASKYRADMNSIIAPQVVYMVLALMLHV